MYSSSAVVWSCFPLIRYGQNHLTRHSERGKKTRQTEQEMGRQHQGMDRPGVQQVPEGSGEQGKMEETGCKIFCGVPTILAVKAWMMMMIWYFEALIFPVVWPRRRKHLAVRPQKLLRLIRDGEVGGSGILYPASACYTVTTRTILYSGGQLCEPF